MSKIRPLLKDLHSPDIYDLSSFYPEEEDRFGFLLQAMVGPEGAEGEESFDIMVCTPKWLEDRLQSVPVITGRHYLIVKQYDIDAIRKYIEAFVEKSSAETWHDVALRLSRLGFWEFEDYIPYSENEK